MNCSTCHFGWIRRFSPNVVVQPNWPTHECRFHAPVAGVDHQGDEISPWPLVNATDACGKWAAPGSDPSDVDPSRLLAQATTTEGAKP